MLSIQAVRGLSRPRAPGIVPSLSLSPLFPHGVTIVCQLDSVQILKYCENADSGHGGYNFCIADENREKICRLIGSGVDK